jgi:hypothetical protein
MAVDYFGNEEDKDKENQPTSTQSALSNDSGILTGNTPNQPQDSSGDKKSASGSFTNLQSYLDANKDQKFGTQVAGKVGETIDYATNQQNMANTQFQNLADKSAVKKNENLINNAVSKPQEVVANQDQFDEFSKMRDARYRGPRNFSDASEVRTYS